MPDVLTIVSDYLRTNGCDGLCCEGCGCGIDNIAPYDSIDIACRAGYRCESCGGYYPTRNHVDHEEATNA